MGGYFFFFRKWNNLEQKKFENMKEMSYFCKKQKKM